ncbi:hypothetical protein B0H21DRAFT_889854 [Amylocystis lapponica]|nr:hypothetical protein B0H21DRAFT_889854 [Amylocystis lapponica]
MAKITSLPTETLTAIAALVKGRNRFNSLYPLSRTCTLLNEICAEFIFCEYELVVRKVTYRGDMFQDHQHMHEWSNRAVKARLAHFRKKAPFVRELVLIDHSYRDQPHEFLPDRMLSALLRSLKTARRITHVTLQSVPPGHRPPDLEVELPLPIWDWIRARSLKFLYIGLNIHAPRGALPCANVDHFNAWIYKDGPVDFLPLVNPRRLSLTHAAKFDIDAKTFQSLMLGARHYNLRTLQLAFFVAHDDDCVSFDFSGVPRADIRIRLSLNIDYKSTPPKQEELKVAMQPRFEEDLSTYKLMIDREYHPMLVIHRPPLVPA